MISRCNQWRDKLVNFVDYIILRLSQLATKSDHQAAVSSGRICWLLGLYSFHPVKPPYLMTCSWKVNDRLVNCLVNYYPANNQVILLLMLGIYLLGKCNLLRNILLSGHYFCCSKVMQTFESFLPRKDFYHKGIKMNREFAQNRTTFRWKW